jgi:FdhE protein
MTTDPAPDPSKIGNIAQPPFAILPDPARVFARRAERLDFLAGSSRLAPYLRFLAAVARAQAALTAELPPPAPLAERRVALARESRMPPIDRISLARDPGLAATLDSLLAAAGPIEMPEAARLALDGVRAADADTRLWLLANVLADDIAPEDAAPHLFVAAAVQVHAARLAATLDARRLVPIGTGVCPCCGGRPATSVVVGSLRVEGARYAACATCATLWNEVRIKCLACGSTKGIGYRSLGDEAVIKAEVCDECHSWVKILYQNRDTALDPVADDVASLGLDATMRDTEWRRAGFDPFLVGF